MAWIELHQSVREHRKTTFVADTLGIPIAQAVGHMALLWCWGLDNATIDGDLGDLVLPATIARAAEWTGDPDEFCKALVKARFLDVQEDHYWLHNWRLYAGRLMEKRQKDAERKREARASEGRPRDIQKTSENIPLDGAGTNRTVPTNHKDPTSGDADASPPDASPVEREILATFRDVAGYPFDFARDLEHIRRLAVDFPRLDIATEARKWATYKLDKPLKPKSNPRSQFRNWCDMAVNKTHKTRGSPHQSSGNIRDLNALADKLASGRGGP